MIKILPVGKLNLAIFKGLLEKHPVVPDEGVGVAQREMVRLDLR